MQYILIGLVSRDTSLMMAEIISLIKHTFSCGDKLIYYENWRNKRNYFYVYYEAGLKGYPSKWCWQKF